MRILHNGTDRRITTAVLLISVGQLTFLKSTCPHSFYINIYLYIFIFIPVILCGMSILFYAQLKAPYYSIHLKFSQ